MYLIMQKRVQCPLCGMLVWGSQVEKYHEIDVKSMKSQGRGRGFKYTRSEDVGLVALVRAKIKALYDRYFPSIKIEPRVHTVPGILARAPIPLKPRVLIVPGVRVE